MVLPKALLFLAICIVTCILLTGSLCLAQSSQLIYQKIDTIATQAVAVDKRFYYSIGNHVIRKYRKKNGTPVATWEGGDSGVVKHLNSGFILRNKLYCANSNYREFPMASSIEVFNRKSLTPINSHSFGIYEGFCTWAIWHKSHWWVMFVHYDNYAPNSNTDVSWTSLVKFDRKWRRIEAWILPKDLLPKIKPYSISVGVFVEDDTLYCTHHHNQEIYVLKLPKMGFTLEWVNTIPVPIQGQGLAKDPSQKNAFWGINRSTKKVISFKVKE